jgi:hypothetical protein
MLFEEKDNGMTARIGAIRKTKTAVQISRNRRRQRFMAYPNEIARPPDSRCARR